MFTFILITYTIFFFTYRLKSSLTKFYTYHVEYKQPLTEFLVPICFGYELLSIIEGI